MPAKHLDAVFLTRDEALMTSFRSRFAESGIDLVLARDPGGLNAALRGRPSCAVMLDSAHAAGTLGLDIEDSVRKLSSLLGPRVILVLTEPATPAWQVVRLLELGAHDVAQKPVNPRILAEQLKALVRVFAREAAPRSRSLFSSPSDAVTIDYPRRKCYLNGDGQRSEVRLTKLEFQVLYLLLQKKGAVVTYEDFAGRLWPAAASHREIVHTLHQLVTNIRRKIAPGRARIENLRAEGFRLE